MSDEKRHLRVLSLGAGVQSTTVYLLALDGKIQPFDAAIFADTQEEPQGVYRHLEWLMREQGIRGGAPILIRTRGKLGDDLETGRSWSKGFTSIPAFSQKPNGDHGKVRRQCTHDYKTALIEQVIRRELFCLPRGRGLGRGMSIEQAVGISSDEAGRAIKIQARIAKRRKWSVDFPLLTLRWTRADCVRYLRGRVPHEVPRSACVFCPFKSDAAWRLLRDHDADGWRRALEIDALLRRVGARVNRGMREPLFLHSSLKPLAEIDFDALAREDARQGWLGFAQECEGMCGV